MKRREQTKERANLASFPHFLPLVIFRYQGKDYIRPHLPVTPSLSNTPSTPSSFYEVELEYPSMMSIIARKGGEGKGGEGKGREGKREGKKEFHPFIFFVFLRECGSSIFVLLACLLLSESLNLHQIHGM